MLLDVFSPIIEPSKGFFSVEIPDDAVVLNVRYAIWNQYQDYLRKTTVNIALHDIQLRYLSHGMDIEPRRTVSARLRQVAWQMQSPDDRTRLNEMTRCGDAAKVQWILQLDVSERYSEGPTTDLLLPAEKAHRETLSRFLKSPAPSSLTTGANWLKHQKNNPVYNGRPFHLHTTPFAMYHPVFANLKSKLSNLSRLPTPSTTRLALVAKLFVTAADIYINETHRQEETMKVIEALLGNFEQNVNIYNESGARVAEADCIKSHIREDGIVCVPVVGEFKNEPDGHPDVQAAATYGLRIAHPNYAKIRNSTCCPAIILSFAGSYLRIYGAVLVDVFILQPLTDIIDLGDDHLLNPQLGRVAKILDAVRVAIHELEEFYTSVAVDDIPGLSRLMPDIRPVDAAFLQELVLEERFQYQGSLPDIRRSLFTGTFGNSRVLVKLCSTYNRTAHELLAGQAPPLAPQLHFFAEVQAGMKVVVMNFLEGNDAHYHFPGSPELPPGVRCDIEKAKNILHQNKWVFGDLRRPNIMVVAREGTNELGGMLLDFDWCGEAGVATYPSFLNVSSAIRWPDGVEPGSVMEMRHDDAMFRV